MQQWDQRYLLKNVVINNMHNINLKRKLSIHAVKWNRRISYIPEYSFNLLDYYPLKQQMYLLYQLGSQKFMQNLRTKKFFRNKHSNMTNWSQADVLQSHINYWNQGKVFYEYFMKINKDGWN